MVDICPLEGKKLNNALNRLLSKGVPLTEERSVTLREIKDDGK